MSVDPYSAEVRSYFVNTEHAGDLDGAAVGYFADQGLRIRLSAKTDEEMITAMRFRAWGCPHVIAAAEAVCRRYEDRNWRELDDFSTAQLMRDLAVPVEKTGRILVLEDALRSLAQAIRDRASTNK